MTCITTVNKPAVHRETSASDLRNQRGTRREIEADTGDTSGHKTPAHKLISTRPIIDIPEPGLCLDQAPKEATNHADPSHVTCVPKTRYLTPEATPPSAASFVPRRFKPPNARKFCNMRGANGYQVVSSFDCGPIAACDIANWRSPLC